MGRWFVLVGLAAMTAMGLAVPCAAQDVTAPCQLCTATNKPTEDAPKIPLSVQVDTSLVFDRLIIAGAGNGSAEIWPDGTGRTSGSITSMGARTMVGEVTVRGEPGRYVRVTLPAGITLTGLSGGAIRVTTIKSDLTAMPKLDSEGRLSFRFGGIVQVEGDSDGEFRGDLPIDVDYF